MRYKACNGLLNSKALPLFLEPLPLVNAIDRVALADKPSGNIVIREICVQPRPGTGKNMKENNR